MKRIVSLILCCFLILSMGACSSKKLENKNKQISQQNAEDYIATLENISKDVYKAISNQDLEALEKAESQYKKQKNKQEDLYTDLVQYDKDAAEDFQDESDALLLEIKEALNGKAAMERKLTVEAYTAEMSLLVENIEAAVYDQDSALLSSLLDEYIALMDECNDYYDEIEAEDSTLAENFYASVMVFSDQVISLIEEPEEIEDPSEPDTPTEPESTEPHPVDVANAFIHELSQLCDEIVTATLEKNEEERKRLDQEYDTMEAQYYEIYDLLKEYDQETADEFVSIVSDIIDEANQKIEDSNKSPEQLQADGFLVELRLYAKHIALSIEEGDIETANEWLDKVYDMSDAYDLTEANLRKVDPEAADQFEEDVTEIFEEINALYDVV